MPLPLLNIDRWKCESQSGLKPFVKFVLPEDVQTFTSATAEAGIEVKPGKEIYHIEIDPATGSNREELRQGRQGDYHERTISFEVRRLRQEMVDLRRALMNRRVHVIFTDTNGLTYLYLNSRLRQAVADNPSQGGKNGTRLEFRGAGVMPAPYVIGELLPGPDPGDVGTPQDTGGGIQDPADPIEPGGGTPGGGPGDDIGGGDPGPGGGGDPGGGGEPDPTDVTFLQPTTGDRFRITIGACEEIITTKVTP